MSLTHIFAILVSYAKPFCIVHQRTVVIPTSKFFATSFVTFHKIVLESVLFVFRCVNIIYPISVNCDKLIPIRSGVLVMVT